MRQDYRDQEHFPTRAQLMKKICIMLFIISIGIDMQDNLS